MKWSTSWSAHPLPATTLKSFNFYFRVIILVHPDWARPPSYYHKYIRPSGTNLIVNNFNQWEHRIVEYRPIRGLETSHQSPHGLARIWPWSWRIWYNLISLVAAVNKPQLTLNLNHHFSLKLSDPANYSRSPNGIFLGWQGWQLWMDGFNTYNSIIDLNFLSSWYFEFAWWYSTDCFGGFFCQFDIQFRDHVISKQKCKWLRSRCVLILWLWCCYLYVSIN